MSNSQIDDITNIVLTTHCVEHIWHLIVRFKH